MKSNDVPQDNARSFEGEKKALYAVDDEGRYQLTASSGWEAEQIVLDLALQQFESQAQTALQRAQKNEASPLEYHMFAQRMDITTLAQSTGFFRWQVRRHCRPQVFTKLSVTKLGRYAEALGISVEQLQQLPLAAHSAN